MNRKWPPHPKRSRGTGPTRHDSMQKCRPFHAETRPIQHRNKAQQMADVKKGRGVLYNGEYFHQYKNFRGLRAWGRSACVKKVGGIDFRRKKPPKIGVQGPQHREEYDRDRAKEEDNQSHLKEAPTTDYRFTMQNDPKSGDPLRSAPCQSAVPVR